MLRGVLQSFFILPAMATPQSTYKKTEDTHTLRIGDLQATVTAVGEVPSVPFRGQRLTPRIGNHFVVVALKFKSLALYPSCPLLEAWLRVDPEFNYSQYRGYWVDPKTYHLQLAEESEGSYLFEVKDGAHPVSLKLVRNTFHERSCMNDQHRRGVPVIIRPKDVTFSLRNLPQPAS
jgi:hypothetical protein